MSPDGSKRPPPPEEKLLKLIRPAEFRAAAEGFAPAAKVASSDGGRSRGVRRLPSWWVNAVNVGLGCLIAGEAMALLGMLSASAPPSSGLPDGLSSVPPQETVQTRPPAERVPSLAAAAATPLFQASSPASMSAAPISAETKALALRLSVIGIIPGDPAQAIVEDGQTKKTYFVNVGQHVLEGLIVQEIREDRIILSLNGEFIELSL